MTQQAIDTARQSLEAELNNAESSINQFFLYNSAALNSLKLVIRNRETITAEEYKSWLDQVLPADQNQFRNVALLEDMVVTHIYPDNDLTRQVLNTRPSDTGRPELDRVYVNALFSNQDTVVGPTPLITGGAGLLYVRPIGDNRRLISGVLSMEQLVEDLTALLPTDTELSLTVSVNDQVMDIIGAENFDSASSFRRELLYDPVRVNVAVNSTNMQSTIRQIVLINQSAFAVLLAIASFLVLLQLRNYDEKTERQKDIEKSESELKSAQRLGNMGSWSSEDGNLFALSDPLQELLGLSVDVLSLAQIQNLIIEQDRQRVLDQFRLLSSSKQQEFTIEHRLNVKNEYRWFEHRVALNSSNQLTGILRDIHSLRTRDEQLAQLESFDPLTGAANRTYFSQLAIPNIALCRSKSKPLTLVLINVDSFRTVNERYGQEFGDNVLRRIAQRLSDYCRSSDVTARLSGDTFALLLPEFGKDNKSTEVIENLLTKLKQPLQLEQTVYPQFSAGISVFPTDGSDYETLLKRAESALNYAKQSLRGNYRYYSEELVDQINRRQQLISAIPEAIEHNQFTLLFQPRIDAKNTDVILGFEALIRWKSPTLGQVSPGEFIPAIESTNLIIDVGQWVIHESFRLYVEQFKSVINEKVISINLSSKQLADKNLVLMIERLMGKFAINPKQFEFEVTEHSLADESQIVTTNMKKLNQLGFKFALDDFGTGYSNLGMLQSLPLHVLKVDMRFVRAINTSRKSDELVKAIVSLGHTLGLTVVAEGVETQTQLDFLQTIQCDELQGYYFYTPLTTETLMTSLTSIKLSENI